MTVLTALMAVLGCDDSGGGGSSSNGGGDGNGGDNTPAVTITFDAQNVGVMETAAKGPLKRLTASTDKAGVDVTFAATEDETGTFALSSTGVVSLNLNNFLDFEDDKIPNVFTMSVTASATGAEDVTQGVTIFVIDVVPYNKEPLTIAEGTYPQGKFVGTMRGFLNDIDVTYTPGVLPSIGTLTVNVIRFADLVFTPVDDPTGTFSVDSEGNVNLKPGKTLDFEGTPQYMLHVTTSTEGVADFTVDATINVTDALELTFKPQTLFIPENSQAGTFATLAEDPATPGRLMISTDLKTDADPTFALAEGEQEETFVVNEDGCLTLNIGQALDFEDAISNTYTVLVTASLAGALADVTAAVTIEVTDVPENTITFAEGQTFSILEGSSEGISVGMIAASTDKGVAVPVVFTAVDDPASPFAVASDGNTTLKAGQELDYETDTNNNSYTLMVTASAEDAADVGPIAVIINVVNVPEDTITFPTGQTFSIAEDTAAGTVIGTLQAGIDKEDATISFVFREAENTTPFTVSSTGEIIVKETPLPDFETNPNQYTLQVVAKAADAADTAAIDVIINVTNVLENTLTIAEGQTFTIAEDAAVGAKVGELDFTATGADPTFAVTGTIFEVTSTGEIKVKTATLDYETSPNQYTVSVTASEADAKSVMMTITINVENVNENVINFTGTTIDVREDAVAGVVGMIDAAVSVIAGGALLEEDPIFAPVDDPSGTFSVDSDGNIILNEGQELDFDAEDATTSYTLMVTASATDADDVGPMDVFINVTDVTTVLTFTVQTFAVSEHAPAGLSVGTLKASALASSDAEDGIFIPVTFVPVDDDTGTFSVDSDGHIVLKAGQSLNYVTKDSYTLMVTASAAEAADLQPVEITITITPANTGAGDGSPGNPYLVFDLDDLQGISRGNFQNAEMEAAGLAIINDPSLLTKYYKLARDIDASATASSNSGNGFLPIGSCDGLCAYAYDDAPGGGDVLFTGGFDGDGYVIRGLTINRTATDGVGLFGYNTGTIKNMALEGGSIKGRNFVGGIVGYNRGTVQDSYATGDVAGAANNRGTAVVERGGSAILSFAVDFYVGGLVGYNTGGGTVQDSYATGDVTGEQHLGGLVGLNSGGTVQDSYATGDVTGKLFLGGLVGYNSSRGRVQNSFARGDITGHKYVGGLVGQNHDRATVQHSLATGNATAIVRSDSCGQGIDPKCSSFAGGLVGRNYGATIQHSFATGSVSGVYFIGGLVGDNNKYYFAEPGKAVIDLSSTVQDSYATGSVMSEIENNWVGRLVGTNNELVSPDEMSNLEDYEEVDLETGETVLLFTGSTSQYIGPTDKSIVRRSYCIPDSSSDKCVGASRVPISPTQLANKAALKRLTCAASTVFRWDHDVDDPDGDDFKADGSTPASPPVACSPGASGNVDDFPWYFGTAFDLPVLNDSVGVGGVLDEAAQRSLIKFRLNKAELQALIDPDIEFHTAKLSGFVAPAGAPYTHTLPTGGVGQLPVALDRHTYRWVFPSGYTSVSGETTASATFTPNDVTPGVLTVVVSVRDEYGDVESIYAYEIFALQRRDHRILASGTVTLSEPDHGINWRDGGRGDIAWDWKVFPSETLSGHTTATPTLTLPASASPGDVYAFTWTASALDVGVSGGRGSGVGEVYVVVTDEVFLQEGDYIAVNKGVTVEVTAPVHGVNSGSNTIRWEWTVSPSDATLAEDTTGTPTLTLPASASPRDAYTLTWTVTEVYRNGSGPVKYLIDSPERRNKCTLVEKDSAGELQYYYYSGGSKDCKNTNGSKQIISANENSSTGKIYYMVVE